MLKLYDPPTARQTILQRRLPDDITVPPAVQERIRHIFGESLTPAQVVDCILRDVRQRGDRALREWSLKLDGSAPQSFLVPPAEKAAALANIPVELRQALELAAERIRQFHKVQPVTSWITQALGGTLGQIVRPIHRVGLYVPAGTAPLPSTVLMSAIPAQVAGVSEIVLVTPLQSDGRTDTSILAAAALLGLEEVYTMGGAQAIAALAFGTASIQRVDKIFGPGNLFVTLAKRQVFGVVGIDNLAGPTETMIIADDTARPEWVAADLLAQAEHDVLASAILLTPSKALIEKIEVEVGRQLVQRRRAEILASSLANSCGAVLTRDLDEAVELANAYAAEHLCLSVAEPWRLVEKIHAAGGVFLGEHSFEVLGDYVAGPSHVMPTGGSARFSSPLNVLDFVHIISLVALDPGTTRQIADAAATIAKAERLDGHAYAAEVRR